MDLWKSEMIVKEHVSDGFLCGLVYMF